MSQNILLEKTPTGVRQPTDSTRVGQGWKTILLNCDCHSFQEVALQLMKAIRCTYDRGMQLANVVHYTGSAIVYSGAKERCEAVAAVLEDIGLLTQIDQ